MNMIRKENVSHDQRMAQGVGALPVKAGSVEAPTTLERIMKRIDNMSHSPYSNGCGATNGCGPHLAGQGGFGPPRTRHHDDGYNYIYIVGSEGGRKDPVAVVTEGVVNFPEVDRAAPNDYQDVKYEGSRSILRLRGGGRLGESVRPAPTFGAGIAAWLDSDDEQAEWEAAEIERRRTESALNNAHQRRQWLPPPVIFGTSGERDIVVCTMCCKDVDKADGAWVQCQCHRVLCLPCSLFPCQCGTLIGEVASEPPADQPAGTDEAGPPAVVILHLADHLDFDGEFHPPPRGALLYSRQ
jgi:hypothetical protein